MQTIASAIHESSLVYTFFKYYFDTSSTLGVYFRCLLMVVVSTIIIMVVLEKREKKIKELAEKDENPDL